MATLPVPCPVRFGVVKSGGLQAQLHRCTLDRNLHKLEKLLKKGKVASVETPFWLANFTFYNSLSQSWSPGSPSLFPSFNKSDSIEWVVVKFH